MFCKLKNWLKKKGMWNNTVVIIITVVGILFIIILFYRAIRGMLT